MTRWELRVSLWCWLFNHEEPVWHCGEKGMEWRCACGRRTPSVLRHLGPYGI